jgi:Arc/MetJ-type ribon-helix-helix transcriptional regulator
LTNPAAVPQLAKVLRKTAMSKHIDPADLPDYVAAFATAQVAAGRFANIEDVLTAGVAALQERPRLLRAAWDAGVKSLEQDGPQLETDDEFNAFLNECESEAVRT